jgi:hypothetical protein
MWLSDMRPILLVQYTSLLVRIINEIYALTREFSTSGHILEVSIRGPTIYKCIQSTWSSWQFIKYATDLQKYSGSRISWLVFNELADLLITHLRLNI